MVNTMTTTPNTTSATLPVLNTKLQSNKGNDSTLKRSFRLRYLILRAAFYKCLKYRLMMRTVTIRKSRMMKIMKSRSDVRMNDVSML